MPTCTRDALISGGACLNGKVMPSHDKLAARVFFDMFQLGMIGGENYSADFPAMMADAEELTCGMTPDDLDTAELVIAYNNYVANGGPELDKDSLYESNMHCLLPFTDTQLRKMKLLLYCKLGEAASQA